MDAKNPQDEFTIAQSLSSHLLNLPPQPRYESAGGLSTRMIIDSASYSTTPCGSPPPEPSHVFSVHDTHHRVPDVAALTAANHLLEHQMHQNEPVYNITSDSLPEKTPALQITLSSAEENMPSSQPALHRGIIPSYMLQAIAASEAAGSDAKASAEQTLRSHSQHTCIKHSREYNVAFAPTAPAQRQSEDGRWTVVS